MTLRRRREEMQAAITKLKNDKNDAAAMLIEVLRYAEVGVKEENGPGYRALNQILDILIEMGYEERLIKEGKGRIQYMAHPKYGDWEGGKFKKEVVFGKENGPTY